MGPEGADLAIARVVELANRVRAAPEVGGLSVCATDEACLALKHPLTAERANHLLREVLKHSFCGRFQGRFNDPATDAGLVWALLGLQDT